MTAIKNVRGYARVCRKHSNGSLYDAQVVEVAAVLTSGLYPVLESISSQMGATIEFHDLASVEEERLRRELNDLAWSFAGPTHKVIARVEYERWDGTKVEFAVN